MISVRNSNYTQPQTPGLKKDMRKKITCTSLLIIGIASYLWFSTSCKKEGCQVKTYANANVILILIDTLRADHLSCYGYQRPTSPHIDELARKGILFDNMLANTSWTRPGTASILTGLYPKNHGAITTKDNLAEEINLMSEILGRHGYSSYGFTANHHAGERAGFNQGYTYFFSFAEQDPNHAFELTVQSDEVNKKVFEVINKLKNKSKNFIFIHYIDPHAPFTPKEKKYSQNNDITFTQERFKSLFYAPRDWQLRKQIHQQIIQAYDDEILFNDKMIGRLLRVLKQNDMYDNSIIIITSDHGEEFYEHGALSHGRTLYEEQLRIPLIIHLPDDTCRKINKIANQVDILPTLLPLLAIAIPDQIDGRDLLDENLPSRKYSFAELRRMDFICSSIQTTDHKLIETIVKRPGQKPSEYYILSKDRGEQKDKYMNSRFTERIKILGHNLNKFKHEKRNFKLTRKPVIFNKKEIKALKGLGYI